MEFAVDSSEDMFAVWIVVLDKFCSGGWEIAVRRSDVTAITGIDFHNYLQLVNTVPFSSNNQSQVFVAHQTCWN
jgi:hypothetical protein